MRICIAVAAVAVLAAGALHSQGPIQHPRTQERRGDAAGYSTHDASVISMMGWGVGLAVGIALLCGCLNETDNGHNGHNGH